MQRWLFSILVPLLLLAGGRLVTQAAQSEDSPLGVESLRTEYKHNPIGIDVSQPRFCWKIRTNQPAFVQVAWQIQVSPSLQDLQREAHLIWDSGRMNSDQSIHVEYGGPELVSGAQYFWRVRVWGTGNEPSPWSDPASFETGLLKSSDWLADWIEPYPADDPQKPSPSPFLRKPFPVRRPVQSARIYATSRGLYELHLNGRRVGDQLFTPGWTSYHHRIQYQTYDVTAYLQSGKNVIAAVLGDGWYRGHIGFRGQRNFYGDRLAFLIQLQIQYTDGSSEIIKSDTSWKWATGPILMSDIYNGERYDARLELPGWKQPDYDDSGWKAVVLGEYSKENLIAPPGPPIRAIQEIKPVQILTTPRGETVVDLGQNMVGWVRLRVNGPEGTTIRLRHAEVLDKDGNFYTENLRAALQTVEYTLKGGSPEEYEPHFTFQGFRYVAVEGFPGDLNLDSLTGIVIHSDMKPTGQFETSHPLVNQLQKNILWGQKGNFLDVPTDCPQRDERLGWTGDAQVFCRTAAFNMDVASFFRKWLGDLAADQRDDGAVPFVVPDVLKGFASAAWADTGFPGSADLRR